MIKRINNKDSEIKNDLFVVSNNEKINVAVELILDNEKLVFQIQEQKNGTQN